MKKIVNILLTTFAVTAFAEYAPPPPPPHMHVQEPAKTLNLDNKYYEMSVGGLSKLMNDLKHDDHATYIKLESLYSSINSRHLWANVALWGGLGAGFALEIVAVTSSIGSTGTLNTPLLIAGTALMVGGPITALFLWPQPSDYLDFVNAYNGAKPKGHLQISASLAPLPNGAMAGLTFRF